MDIMAIQMLLVTSLFSTPKGHFAIDSRATLQILTTLNETDVKVALPTKSLLRHEPQEEQPSTRTIDTLLPEDWKTASANRFLEIQTTTPGVHHTVFASRSSTEPHQYDEPCVAHCIAGQPRNLISVKGLWKSLKYRLFHQMSVSHRIFAALALGAQEFSPGEEGSEGYVRGPQIAVKNEDVLPSMHYLGVERALLIRESCTTGACLQKGLRLKCKASDMHITELYDKSTGMYTNLCEVQVSRFADCMHVVKGYENEHKLNFQWITRVRPDVYWVRPAPSLRSLDPDKAYFAPWAPCGYGGMDWFYALPRRHAETIAQFSSGIQCSHFNHKRIQSASDMSIGCLGCPGCECWMAAWMFANNVNFTRLPWGWATPLKFCGVDSCLVDWQVTPQSIMGLDPRSLNEPCKRTETGFVSCPAF